MSSILIGIIEDEDMVRESICNLISAYPGFELCCAHPSVESFLGTTFKKTPDIILLDIGLGGGVTGLQGLKDIKHKCKDADIIMLSTFDDEDRIFKALCGGATAYITKQTPFAKIAEAINIVHRGGSYMSPSIARKVVTYFAPSKQTTSLTARQLQVVQGVVDGLSYKMIADKLLISVETVRDHIKKIYRKLDINSRTELIKKSHNGDIV